jgi:hypothetical protein
MIAKPGGGRLTLPVGQERHDAAAFEVADQSAVTSSATPREVVDPDSS